MTLPPILHKILGKAKFIVIQNWYKAITHNLILSPVGLTGFLFLTAYLRTGSREASKEEVSSKFQSSFIFYNLFWPGINFMAYHYVPNHLRILFFDAFGFLYSIGLSLLINMPKVTQ